MTRDELRALIAANPGMVALAHAEPPQTQLIADTLSVGRVRWVQTEVGNGTILEVLGLTAGNALLDAINGNSDFRYVKPLVEEGRLRLDSALVRATLQALVGPVLTQEQANALLARAQAPDPIGEFEVRCAVFNDDGSIAV